MYGRSVIISITLCVVSPLAISQPPPAVPDTGYALVDSLAYSEKLAPKIWQPMAGGKEVSLIEIGGAKVLRMPCNFKDAKTRAGELIRKREKEEKNKPSLRGDTPVDCGELPPAKPISN